MTFFKKPIDENIFNFKVIHSLRNTEKTLSYYETGTVYVKFNLEHISFFRYSQYYFNKI